MTAYVSSGQEMEEQLLLSNHRTQLSLALL